MSLRMTKEQFVTCIAIDCRNIDTDKPYSNRELQRMFDKIIEEGNYEELTRAYYPGLKGNLLRKAVFADMQTLLQTITQE